MIIDSDGFSDLVWSLWKESIWTIMNWGFYPDIQKDIFSCLTSCCAKFERAVYLRNQISDSLLKFVQAMVAST